ncbi:hypothetical protein WMF45_46525 [Sorangium sp. So ce448]|uniref:restriction endonuclease subunit S n=1 Tax=Sorangium sp. So ce448 TaxID=3133314 RepID=UPI003F60EE5A
MSELPDGWAWPTLQEIAASEPNAMTDGPFGSNLKTSDYVTHGVRVIRLGNLGAGEFLDFDRAHISESKYEALKKHEVFPGDLVIAALAEPVGRCVEVPASLGKAVVKADCVRLKVDSELDRRYVMHCLNSPDGRKRAEEAAHGIGRLRINMADMRTLRIPLAPALEQRRIVAKIDALTAKSRRAKEALDAIPALLERLRQSVLAAAFRGDLTADWREKNPDVEPAEELLKRIRAERRRRWEEAELAKMRAKGKVPGDDRWKEKYEEPAPVDASDLPELPEGWCWATVDQLTETIQYGTSAKTSDNPSGVAVLRMGNIVSGQLDTSELKYLPADHEEFPGLLLDPGDVLFNRTNSPELVGKTAVYTGHPETCSFASYLIRMRIIEVPPEIVSWFINGPHGRNWVTSVVSQQVGQANVNGTKLRSLAIPIAPRAELKEMLRRINHAVGSVRRVERLVSELASQTNELDRATLDKAFRGELVPQDPNDEPASVLLERLRAEREQNAKTTNGAGRRRTAASPAPSPSASAVPGRKSPASRRSQASARSRG